MKDREVVIDTGEGGAGRRRLLVRAIGLGLIVTSVVLGTFLIVALFAWQSGQTLRVEQEQAHYAEQISRQIELAQENADQGSYNLAIDRLEWVLAQEPDNAQALALRQRVVATRQAGLLPSTPPPTQAAEPTTDAADSSGVVAATLVPELARLRTLVTRRQWDDALPAILAFQWSYPDFERLTTDRLLYDTYLNLGLETIKTEKVGLGVNYLNQAEQLGDLPQEAKDFRYWAELYQNAIAYYGVDWGMASTNFRELCLSAPFYQNACDRFFDSLANYGDQLAFGGDWCAAELAYQEAWSLRSTDLLEGKLSEARTNCAAATTVPLTDTVPLEGETLPGAETPPSEALPSETPSAEATPEG